MTLSYVWFFANSYYWRTALLSRTLYSNCEYSMKVRRSGLSFHWMNFYHHKEDGQE
jgi:hypothetical protein